MPRVVHFEIYADDIMRAKKFYEDVFGWQIKKWEGESPMDYYMVETGSKDVPGINGGMLSRKDMMEIKDVRDFRSTIDVPSVDEYVQKIVDSGGTILKPKMDMPGVGSFAGVQDTEGNNFVIMTSDMGDKM